MKGFMKVGKICAFLSAMEMCIPLTMSNVGAAEPTSSPVQQQRQAASPGKVSMDVVTNAVGEMRGAVVNQDSAPSVNANVVLCRVNGKEPQGAVTDASGRFVFKNVQPGMYTLAVSGNMGVSHTITRVWTSETAPPAASPVALVTLRGELPQQSDIVRGQDSDGPTVGGLLLGGAVVGAGTVGIVALAGGFKGSGSSNPSSP